MEVRALSAAESEEDFFRAAPKRGARVVVLGAAGGLGTALVQACERLQLRVAALDLASALANASSASSTHRIPFDATDDQSTRRAVDDAAKQLGGIDHLFNLVGFSTIPPLPLSEVTTSEWDRIIDGNLRSAFLTASAVLPHMHAEGSSIVFVTSTMTIGPNKGYGAYIAAKSGVAGLVKALALENAPKVRVNAVAPSAMLTPFMGGGPASSKDSIGKWDWFDPQAAAAAMPMKRLCTTADVVGPMLFLSSPLAGFMTGQVLHVSGGRVMP